jgi:Protein NO VEIN, C-terminal
MGTYVLTANPDATDGMDKTVYHKICIEVRGKGRSETGWTVGHMNSPLEQEAQERHGNLTGQVIMLRQGKPNKRGIIAFGERLTGPIALKQGQKMTRIEAPVVFYRAVEIDEEPLITADQLKRHRFPQEEGKTFPRSGWEIKDDDLAALESCCIDVCGISLSALCSARGSDTDTIRRGAWSTTPDTAHNARVEAAAIACVLKHFLSAQPTDRQRDNCGWDYEFATDGRTFCVEVKGLSGTGIHVELTPNEFQAMDRAMNRAFLGGDYRLAVVCEALSETPKLFLFAHDTGMDWLCELSQRRITASLRTAARLE